MNLLVVEGWDARGLDVKGEIAIVLVTTKVGLEARVAAEGGAVVSITGGGVVDETAGEEYDAVTAASDAVAEADTAADGEAVSEGSVATVIEAPAAFCDEDICVVVVNFTVVVGVAVVVDAAVVVGAAVVGVGSEVCDGVDNDDVASVNDDPGAAELVVGRLVGNALVTSICPTRLGSRMTDVGSTTVPVLLRG